MCKIPVSIEPIERYYSEVGPAVGHAVGPAAVDPPRGAFILRIGDPVPAV